MENKKVSIMLVGIGGYASLFVDEVLKNKYDMPYELVGCVAPRPKNAFHYDQLVERNIPIYPTVEDFYAEHTADLAVISTPIHFHKDQIVYCVEHGSDVLCEKPICSLMDDVKEIIEARDKSGRNVSIGYQWSHSEPILNLKADVLNGTLGRPVRMKTLVLWPRDIAYYNRGSGWGGKKIINDDTWILDSVASNATAHYLHNMLFVSGPTLDTSCDVASITVETYRANDIETYDTCTLRATAKEGFEMLFVVSHAISPDERFGPVFEYEFENGTVKFYRDADDNECMTATLNDGRVIEYGSPSEDIQNIRKMHVATNIVLGKAQVVCGPEAASAHTKCVNAITEAIPETPVFPEEYVVYDEENPRKYCKGLAEILHQVYETGKLPSELGAPWAKAAVTKDVSNYDSFTLK